MHEHAWDSTLLAVGLEPQLFVDNMLIASVQDATRRWHAPKRYQDGPLFTEDRPWEHRLWTAYYGSTTLIRDPDDGLFKCWYQDQEGDPRKGETAGDRPPANFAMRATLLYAQSSDGVHWEKPELDVRTIDGRRTNIVLGGGDFGDAHAMTVVRDPYPPRPEERFRGMLRHIWYEGATRRRVTTCVHSPDGIHWSVYPDMPTFGSRGGSPGDVNILWYDEHSREFVVNIRAQHRRPPRRREPAPPLPRARLPVPVSAAPAPGPEQAAGVAEPQPRLRALERAAADRGARR